MAFLDERRQLLVGLAHRHVDIHFPGAHRVERIVLAHGALVEEDARAVFDEVAGRLLRIAARRGPVRRRLNRLLARRM